MSQITAETARATTGHPTAWRMFMVFTTFLLRRHARAFLFWGLGIAIYAALMIASFPAFEGTGTLDVSQYPEGLREAFNLQSMETIEPYLSAQLFNFLPLIISFLPVTLLSAAIIGAEERRSLDILFGTPLPRATFIGSLWLAVVVLMLTMLGTVGLLSYVTAILVEVDLALTDAMAAAMNVAPITLAFGSLALLLSARLRQRGAVIGGTVALLFLMYLADILGKISDTYEPLRNISAFAPYGDAIRDGMPWGGATLLMMVSFALAALAIPVFERRDILT